MNKNATDVCAGSECSTCVDHSASDGALTTSCFHIATMDCATEESEIRRALESVAGIQQLRFQLTTRTLDIAATPDTIAQAVIAIRRVGFDPQPIGVAVPSDNNDHAVTREGVPRLVFALGLAVAAEALSFFTKAGMTATLAEMLLAATAIALSGFTTYKKGLVAFIKLRLNINALMSIAVTGAFLIGQWPEAAMVMALYAIAELIEARSADRARNAIQSLMALAPEQAEVRQTDGTWKSTPARSVPVGATIRIRPGERVSLDGVVELGVSAINQAPVTGESMPVDKTIGDTVFAGTINESAELEVRVTAVADDSTLARIIHAVEQAQGTQAPTQRYVDRFAAIYTPSVFLLAVAVAVGTPLLFDWTWMDAAYKALVLLVVACPCALVISTPVTVVSALANAARRGILIKGGTYLEEARKLRCIALDKTGTITEGKPQLVEFAAIDQSFDKAQLALLAASLAARSDHPVSIAIASGLKIEGRGVTDFKALMGRGVQGTVDGHVLVLGNHRLIEERGQCNAALESQLFSHESAGRTVTLLASDAGVHGLFAVADAIKPSSRQAIAELKAMGITSVMLTGDNAATAKTIATQAGIDDAHGNLLPENKLNVVRNLQQRYGLTAMAGDGINDAPALARADIGIAMGAVGTDTAMEAADIVIMNDDLRRIPEVIRLSRDTHTVLWQNITLALSIKAVFMALTVFNHATMWMAVFADMGASLIVVANGLRMLRK